MSGSEDMKIDPTRAAALVTQIKGVGQRVSAAANGRNVRLVAVSKLKPANDILALHRDHGQLHFGENYAQELGQKAELLPRSIRWHMIGGLQSGHCKNLARIPNLWCVSSVDTPKKAQLLNKHRAEAPAASSSSTTDDSTGTPAEKLNVHVQVNTSGEAAKSGCSPGADTLALCRLIEQECPNLRLLGLMTIGAIARSMATTVGEGDLNEDFMCLKEQRDMVVRELFGTDADGTDSSGRGKEIELSMGMSEDFEGAIAAGSDEVRVGSTIFGTRPPKAEAKLTE